MAEAAGTLVPSESCQRINNDLFQIIPTNPNYTDQYNTLRLVTPPKIIPQTL